MSTELRRTVYPGKIYDGLLDRNQCKYYRNFIDELAWERGNKKYFQDIRKIPQISGELWKLIKKDLPPKVRRNGNTYELVGLSDHITVSRHNGEHIGIHQDKDVLISYKGRKTNSLYCFYKLAIYLNDLSNPHDVGDRTGGTKFYDNHHNLVYIAKPKEGRGVLFDMREWHSGTRVPKGRTKYMLGARPIYKKVYKRENHSSKRCKCRCHER